MHRYRCNSIQGLEVQQTSSKVFRQTVLSLMATEHGSEIKFIIVQHIQELGRPRETRTRWAAGGRRATSRYYTLLLIRPWFVCLDQPRQPAGTHQTAQRNIK